MFLIRHGAARVAGGGRNAGPDRAALAAQMPALRLGRVVPGARSSATAAAATTRGDQHFVKKPRTNFDLSWSPGLACFRFRRGPDPMALAIQGASDSQPGLLHHVRVDEGLILCRGRYFSSHRQVT